MVRPQPGQGEPRPLVVGLMSSLGGRSVCWLGFQPDLGFQLRHQLLEVLLAAERHRIPAPSTIPLLAPQCRGWAFADLENRWAFGTSYREFSVQIVHETFVRHLFVRSRRVLIGVLAGFHVLTPCQSVGIDPILGIATMSSKPCFRRGLERCDALCCSRLECSCWPAPVGPDRGGRAGTNDGAGRGRGR